MVRQKLYKVRADNLDAAYAKMRRQLGGEAVVVSTQQVTEGGVLGLFGQRRVEITASVPVSAEGPLSRAPSAVERRYAQNSTLAPEPEAGPAAPPQDLEDFKNLIRDAQRRMNGQAPPPSPGREGSARAAGQSGESPVLAFPAPKPKPDQAANDLRREVQEIREMMQVLYAESPGAGLPAELAPHYRTLVGRGMSRKAAAALIGAVLRNSDLSVIRDPRVFSERLHFEMRRLVRVTGGIAIEAGRRRVVALCGATGVGKTTNLAKLAAYFSVHERARVALVTTDTYRVGAPEQLRVYANIIGLPLRVADDPKDVVVALKELHDMDLVLIDTAGGSQFNLEQISELKGILQVAQPHETILALSVNTQLEDLRNVVSNFKCLQPTSVVFTKLDETRQYGAMLSLLAEADLPLSYVSTGQNVPDDIRVATPGMIANLILEGKEHRG